MKQLIWLSSLGLLTTSGVCSALDPLFEYDTETTQAVQKEKSLSNEFSLYSKFSLEGKDVGEPRHLKTELSSDYDKTFANDVQVSVGGKASVDVANELYRHDWNEATDETYKTNVELKQAWVKVPLSERASLKAGRQVVALGNSDFYKNMDVVNPIDLRYPGTVRLDQLRLPKGAMVYQYEKPQDTNSDALVNGYDVSLVYGFENRFDELPPHGSDFALQPVPVKRKQANNLNGSDVTLHVTYEALGLENQAMLSRHYHATPRITQTPLGTLESDHLRVNQVGLSSKFIGKRTELFVESSVLKVDDDDVKKTKANHIVGVAYNGFKNTRISAEGFANNFDNYDQAAINVNRSFNNGSLNAGVNYVHTDYDDAGDSTLASAYMTYEHNDQVTVRSKAVHFTASDDSPTKAWADNDFVDVNVSYSF
ncbi:MAG: hypothetical protein AAGF06_01430 [Pseudomonadota bacterium]